MTTKVDVAVVGGGILGLAHAWAAARRGLRAVLLERSPAAQGASIRNFGMVWPIGQPAGEPYAIALRSRDFWRELASQGVVDAQECGAVHLAHHGDEMAVLEEFCGRCTHEARLLTSGETLARAPMANPDGLVGGMWSPSELRVDPRAACGQIAAWLAERHGVHCHFDAPVVGIEARQVRVADGRRFAAERVVVCSGSDLTTLYPDVLRASGLRLCKLQMLKTGPQASFQADACHIASGLTLRHYDSFRDCPSLAAVRDRIATEAPELDRYGIHVMASQASDGGVVLGDSHEYGEEITPFDNAEIEALMLRELRKVIRLGDWTIRQRWHGIYAKHRSLLVYEHQPEENVHVSVGPGGAGMTMSFGLAERAWKNFCGEQP